MAKPHLYSVIESLHKQTQLYTQRRSNAEAPANYRFTVDDIFNFLVVEYGIGQSVTIVPSPIGYIPTLAGNTENLSQFVIDPNADIWFIDQNGNAIRFLTGDKTYVHHQEIAAENWNINHEMGKVPSILTFDATDQIVGQVEIIDTDNTRIKFTIPVSGFAYLN